MKSSSSTSREVHSCSNAGSKRVPVAGPERRLRMYWESINNMETAINNAPQPVFANRGGRPPLRNWTAEKPELEALITSGWGLMKLSCKYKMSIPGIRAVLKRLGLRTHGQPQRSEVA
jgi:hypothetical protein